MGEGFFQAECHPWPRGVQSLFPDSSPVSSRVCGFLQREQVVGIIDKSLHAMGNSKPALARNFLDLAVLLLSYGEVAAVMQMADKW